MSNQNLGDYNMVLSLSEAQINHQLQRLHGRFIRRNKMFVKKTINKKEKLFAIWRLLSNLEGNETMRPNKKKDSNFEEALQNFKNKNQKKYQIALDALTEAPQIEVIEYDTKSLYFYIAFESGKLLYLQENQLRETDLVGKKYVFSVPIGKVEIADFNQLTEDAKEKIKGLNDFKKDRKLSSQDFTIESLFLDFNNANIISFDEKRSELPSTNIEKEFFQRAIANYFKSIKSDDNPYILGYAVRRRKLKETPDALFQPTGVAYSSNYSSQKDASAFNFLMLLDNRQFPTSGKAGVLPTSLIEKRIDKSKTIHGVYAINNDDFLEKYIKYLHKQISIKMEERFKSTWKKDFKHSEIQELVSSFTYKGKDAEFVFSLIPMKIGSISENNQSITLCYDIQVFGHVYKKLDGIIYSNNLSAKFLFNTFGGRQIKDRPKPKNGKLIFTIQTVGKGKFDIKSSFVPPVLGQLLLEPIFDSKADEVIWIAKKTINLAAKLYQGIFTFIIDIKGIGEIFKPEFVDINFTDSIINEINKFSLDSISNKIILPINQVYTFKNIRYLSGNTTYKQNDGDALLFDISYSPLNA